MSSRAVVASRGRSALAVCTVCAVHREDFSWQAQRAPHYSGAYFFACLQVLKKYRGCYGCQVEPEPAALDRDVSHLVLRPVDKLDAVRSVSPILDPGSILGLFGQQILCTSGSGGGDCSATGSSAVKELLSCSTYFSVHAPRLPERRFSSREELRVQRDDRYHALRKAAHAEER